MIMKHCFKNIIRLPGEASSRYLYKWQTANWINKGAKNVHTIITVNLHGIYKSWLTGLSAWFGMAVQHEAFSVPLSYAGLVTMIISAGTICSSLMSERLTKKFGTQIVTVCSVLLTAAALFGFSTSSAFYMLCLWAIPYGLAQELSMCTQ